MSRVYVPARDANSWRPLLKDPEKQWRQECSAWEIAHSWQSGEGSLPPRVQAALDPVLPKLKPLLILPEHKVPLPGGGAASQTDVWVLARGSSGLVSMAVEGKVTEPFGDTVATWSIEASEGKRARLQYLAQLLGLPEPVAPTLRYQLLHRAAAALIEAQRFNAQQAVMLVHSFSAARAGLEDYQAFVAAMGGGTGIPGRVSSVGSRGGVELFLGWVEDAVSAPTSPGAG